MLRKERGSLTFNNLENYDRPPETDQPADQQTNQLINQQTDMKVKRPFYAAGMTDGGREGSGRL